jgi:hypothetical protein
MATLPSLDALLKVAAYGSTRKRGAVGGRRRMGRDGKEAPALYATAADDFPKWALPLDEYHASERGPKMIERVSVEDSTLFDGVPTEALIADRRIVPGLIEALPAEVVAEPCTWDPVVMQALARSMMAEGTMTYDRVIEREAGED